MIWLFERHQQRARLEILHLTTDNFEVRFTDEAGVDHVEYWTDVADVARRQVQVLTELNSQGWTKTGGWKL